MFDTLLSLIDLVVSFIFDFLKKYVFSGLIKIISVTIKFITGNILNVFSLFGELLNEIKKPFNIILDIPFHKYLILVIDYIINIIIEYYSWRFYYKKYSFYCDWFRLYYL